MNNTPQPGTSLATIALITGLLAACAATPVKPVGVDSLRSRLIALQSNNELASRVPLALKETEAAVTTAERPQADRAMAAHTFFMADRSISVAQALAEGRAAVDQRQGLEAQRDNMRLAARTEEADAANRRAALAQGDAETQRREAGAERIAAAEARAQASAAGDAAALAERNSSELQDQYDLLAARSTERGLVLTLGDVLFSTGSAMLNSGGTTQLSKLAGFLNKYPERTAVIEGHTDNVGNADANLSLSQRRAEAVRVYLLGESIAAQRLTASGRGERAPIGNNDTTTGRQQNRRVEVIISTTEVAR